MKVAFHTLGCKVNQYETETLREMFVNKNYEIVDDDSYADLYIINTCTVTGLADRKSRQVIRRMKKRNPNGIIAVTGCYAQISPDEVGAIEGVNIVLGIKEKTRLIDYVEQYIKERAPLHQVTSLEELTNYEETEPIMAMESRTRAFIKVQEGCDRCCTYCVVPLARGAVRSRAADSIVSEAENLIQKGFKEIIITGINTALYGTEEGFSDVSDSGLRGIESIIDKLNRLSGDFRIRLSSLEPTVVDAAAVKRLMKYEKLCHHIHLSVQSGSDKIVKQMNRQYTIGEYMEIVWELRKFDSDYGISTDIIVGFPGEEDQDFDDSVSLVQTVDFCKVHVFKYSPRKGTPAADMQGQISGLIKNTRGAALIREGEASAKRFFENNLGKIKRVLVEEYLEDIDCYTGYSENYIRVYINKNHVNQINVNTFYDVVLKELFQDGIKAEL